jgi:hypothetical protein
LLHIFKVYDSNKDLQGNKDFVITVLFRHVTVVIVQFLKEKPQIYTPELYHSVKVDTNPFTIKLLDTFVSTDHYNMSPFQSSSRSGNRGISLNPINLEPIKSSYTNSPINESYDFQKFLLRDSNDIVNMMVCPCHVLYTCPFTVDSQTGKSLGEWTYFSIVTYHYLKIFSTIQAIVEVTPPIYRNKLPLLYQHLMLASCELKTLEGTFEMYAFNTTQAVLNDFHDDAGSTARLIYKACEVVGINRPDFDNVSPSLKALESFVAKTPCPGPSDPQLRDMEHLRDCGIAIHEHALLTLDCFNRLAGSWQHEAACKNALSNYQTMIRHQKHDISGENKKSIQPNVMREIGQNSKSKLKKIGKSLQTSFSKLAEAIKRPSIALVGYTHRASGYHQLDSINGSKNEGKGAEFCLRDEKTEHVPTHEQRRR